MLAYQRILESGARTATNNVEVEYNGHPLGQFVIDTTAGVTGVNTLTVSIEGFDAVSGKWYQLDTTAAITTNTTTVLTINPDVNNFLPRKFRVVATHATGASITYSIGVNLGGLGT